MKMKNKTIASFILITSLLFGSVKSLNADSIWGRKNKSMKTTYIDGIARGIGDLLTIKISGTSIISNSSSRNMEKKTNRGSSFNGDFGIDHFIPSVPAFKVGTGTEYKNKFDSKNARADSRSFSDNITVVVVDIMPNGNLVILGTCRRDIDKDVQTVEVSGIVRPHDINSDNEVDSKHVANFNIITKYSGVEAAYNNPNWLGRIMDIIWPF